MELRREKSKLPWQTHNYGVKITNNMTKITAKARSKGVPLMCRTKLNKVDFRATLERRLIQTAYLRRT